MTSGIFPIERADLRRVDKLIDDFSKTFLPPNWVWRKGQREVIKDISRTYIDKTHKFVILDAGTGSDKSIIAMCISYILNNINKTDLDETSSLSKGYILASDISLQDQYELDFKKFNLNWGCVKGVDNYICTENDEKHSLGECKLRNKQPKTMHCYNQCPYYKARDHAMNSMTSLLNYSYWLIMMNYVYSNSINENGNIIEGNAAPLFFPRDFTICDEAHKILDIVQNHFSPRFDNNTLEKIEKLTSFYNDYKVANHEKQNNSLKINIDKLYNEENQEKLLNLLEQIELDLENYKPSHELLKNKIKESNIGKTVSKEWRKAAKNADYLKDIHCKIEDYIEIIKKSGIRNLIKNPGIDKELVFNCLQESYLMNKYFHKWSNFTVLMSATISDPTEYMRSLNISNAKYIKMENTFDFTKSPIIYIPGHKMSYKDLNTSLPWLYKKIDKIASEHSTEGGIIHSASYDLALKIFTNCNKKTQSRLLVYNGTSEKKEVLEILKREKNKILIGPSLLEGLDLRDDWSRFQIFAKVPYLSLGDKFVSAKMKLNNNWYQWKTVISICQGAGRSIRNENDYAITYILDGCFGDLLFRNRKMFPNEFLYRLKLNKE